MYLIRLDDASDFMDIKKWSKMEKILDKYNIKPVVGIIPNNKDLSFIKKYKKDELFWKKALSWQKKNWIIAMHGYEHVYCTDDGGINPVQKRSEFAGLSLEEQRKKINKGFNILKNYGLSPKVFFAPSHTFDNNTLEALKKETNIRIISDTIASRVYFYNDFFFIPQQSGSVRNIPLKVVTFCYHPNSMSEDDFIKLDSFIKNNQQKFISFSSLEMNERNRSLFDIFLSKLYFIKRSLSK